MTALVSAERTFAGTLPAIQRTDDHRYRSFEMPPGEYVPGCTTVIGMLDKQWLQRWYANMAAEAALELYAARKIKGATRDQIAAAGGARRDAAAIQGTQLHAYAETYVKGERLPDWIEPQNIDRLEAFKRWWDASGWTLRLSEAPVIKPPSESSPYGWGGTIDLLCRDKEGRTVLADIKTGANVGRDAVLQLTGYGMASRIAPSMDAQQAYPMPLIHRYIVLHVTNQGVKPIERVIGQNERSAFYSCLDLYYWTKTAGAKI
jgi:hypothetical protein